MSGQIKIPKKTQSAEAPEEKPKRKAGERAKMTREEIFMRAIKFWRSKNVEDFSLGALAGELGVAPATIRFHFKGGVRNILDEISRSTLEGLTPPFAPLADPRVYLIEVFREALESFRGGPSLSRQIILRLTDRPLLSPLFAERICATVGALAKEQDPARGFELVINRLAGLVLIETGAWAVVDPAQAEANMKAAISNLSTSDFATLHKVSARLGLHYNKRAEAAYFDQLAVGAVDEIIKELNSTTISQKKI
jgi:AcrR family transcriptional regulator